MCGAMRRAMTTRIDAPSLHPSTAALEKTSPTKTTSALHELVIDTGAKFIKSVERFIADGSLVGEHNIFSPEVFPWSTMLEENWQVIRQELDQLMPYWDHLPSFHQISKDQWRLDADDQWKTFFFYAYGERADENCKRCPETVRLIESIPGMKTALFSILGPGKHIPSHRGPFKGVMRYMLGLRVPEPKERCRIQIGPDTVHWEEGKSLVFDDTYPHEVWNDTDGYRAVLFLDIVRPLKQPAKMLNAAMLEFIRLSPFVQGGIENYKAWERKLEEVCGPAGAPHD